jgi:hypothetical protein
VVHLKKDVYAVRTDEDVMTRLQAAVITTDANMSRLVRESVVHPDVDKCRFDHLLCNY